MRITRRAEKIASQDWSPRETERPSPNGWQATKTYITMLTAAQWPVVSRAQSVARSTREGKTTGELTPRSSPQPLEAHWTIGSRPPWRLSTPTKKIATTVLSKNRKNRHLPWLGEMCPRDLPRQTVIAKNWDLPATEAQRTEKVASGPRGQRIRSHLFNSRFSDQMGTKRIVGCNKTKTPAAESPPTWQILTLQVRWRPWCPVINMIQKWWRQ